jgi:prepilin-type N-terminal cleavage/methylation domain-containing protein
MKPPSNPRQCRPAAFTLVELLAVVSIIALMLVAARPAMEAISGATSTSRSAEELSRLVQYARTYALSNNTYVRLALHETPAQPASGSRARLYLIPFYAAAGVKDGDMADALAWRQLGNPVVLENLRIDESLNSGKIDLSRDFSPLATPSHGRGTNIPTVDRSIPAISSLPVRLEAFVQFSPLGEVSVRSDELVRYVTIGCDRAEGNRGTNPFIVRISGATGSVRVLRKEDL